MTNLDYNINLNGFCPKESLDKMIFYYTIEFLNKSIDRLTYIYNCYDILNVSNINIEDSYKYLLYSIEDTVSFNPNYLYQVFFNDTKKETKLDILLLCLSRMNNRINEIVDNNFDINIIMNYYKSYVFIYLLLSIFIIDNKYTIFENKLSHIQYKFQNLNELIYYYNKLKSIHNNTYNLSKFKIDVVKIQNLNKEIEEVLDSNNDIIIMYLLKVLKYIIFIFNSRIKKLLNISYNRYDK